MTSVPVIALVVVDVGADDMKVINMVVVVVEVLEIVVSVTIGSRVTISVDQGEVVEAEGRDAVNLGGSEVG